MSLVDLGKKLLEAARAGQDDEVRILMANGAPFTTDWVKKTFSVFGTSHFSSPAEENRIITIKHFHCKPLDFLLGIMQLPHVMSNPKLKLSVSSYDLLLILVTDCE